jgi:transposase-like protein
MDPSATFCPHLACPDKGRVGQGNIHIHAQATQRYRCTTCGHTFTATTNTPFYRLHHAADLVTLVLTLLAHGCPLSAIVAAFALDERTVRAWLHRAGNHGAALHAHLVQEVAVGQVQADEIRARLGGGAAWIGLALALPSRLWLGGVVSRRRDGALIRLLLLRVRACAASAAFLLCVDGYSAYLAAAWSVLRVPLRTGRRGRPRLAWPEGFLLAQVIKSHQGRRLQEIIRRVVVGTEETVAHAIAATHGGTVINTAYIERFNALIRAQLAPLVRRRRTPAHGTALLTSGIWLVGCAYNWCWSHQSLRLRAIGTGHRYLERTPAMAAGLTDHVWTISELLHYRVPPVPLSAPRAPRRGRPSAGGRLLPFPTASPGTDEPPERGAA